MKGRFLKHKQNYYRKINHLMNRINLEYNIERNSYNNNQENVFDDK